MLHYELMEVLKKGEFKKVWKLQKPNEKKNNKKPNEETKKQTKKDKEQWVCESKSDLYFRRPFIALYHQQHGTDNGRSKFPINEDYLKLRRKASDKGGIKEFPEKPSGKNTIGQVFSSQFVEDMSREYEVTFHNNIMVHWYNQCNAQEDTCTLKDTITIRVNQTSKFQNKTSTISSTR